MATLSQQLRHSPQQLLSLSLSPRTYSVCVCVCVCGGGQSVWTQRGARVPAAASPFKLETPASHAVSLSNRALALAAADAVCLSKGRRLFKRETAAPLRNTHHLCKRERDGGSFKQHTPSTISLPLTTTICVCVCVCVCVMYYMYTYIHTYTCTSMCCFF